MTGPLPTVVLAMDTSGPVARAALVARDGQVLAAGERRGPRHSATLLPLCHDLLSAHSLKVAQLAAVFCARGPGSFTGLRVGLAVAKGLALAHDLPLLTVSSLAALARDLAPGAAALLAPCIDAGKGEVYGQLHRPDGTALTEELRLLPAAYAERIGAEAAGAPVIVAGTGVDRHPDVFTQALGAGAVRVDFAGPTAASVAGLALPRLERGERDDLDSVIPSYGRPPDITTPKK